jgi:hypothetical protein
MSSAIDARGRLAGTALSVAFLMAASYAVTVGRTLQRRVPATLATARETAVALPHNATARWTLARVDLAAGRPTAALTKIRSAQRRAPLVANLWLERAEVALQAGRLDEARHAAEHGVALAPVDADGCRRAALVLLQANDLTGAAPYLRCELEYGQRQHEVLDLAHAVYGDDATVLATVVPSDGASVRRYLTWAHDRSNVDAALLAWQALAPYGPTAAERLRQIDFLVTRGAIAPAEALWVATYGAHRPGSLFDGGFEGDPIGVGFGWILRPVDGARMALTATAAAHGQRGLSIEFQGGNLDFGDVWQVVPVVAAHRYHLSALVRSDGVTSLSGPRFRVEGHTTCPGMVPADGPEIRGTRAWGPVAVEFATPLACQAVLVRVVRPPTERLDRDLRGRLDVDDVTLRDLGSVEQDDMGVAVREPDVPSPAAGEF